MLLLSEIMARLHGIEMPVVQFIHASGEGNVRQAAGSFARASAACLGRTLLVRRQPVGAPPLTQAASAASMPTVSRRRARKSVVDAFEIVPDSAMASLFHVQIGRETQGSLQAMQASPEAWLDSITLDFRLIVIESDAPERSLATLELARRCHGSVLVVTAGTTSLSQARTAMRQVQLAGGTLLGSVLQDAPPPPRLRINSWRHRPLWKSTG
jgi:hypothetical protein